MAEEKTEIQKSEVVDAAGITEHQEQPNEEATKPQKVKDFFNRRFQHKPGRMKRIATNAVIGSVVMGGGSMIGSQLSTGDPLELHKEIIAAATQWDSPDVKKSTIDSVSHILSKPDTSAMKQMTAPEKGEVSYVKEYALSTEDASNPTDVLSMRQSENDFHTYKEYAAEQAAKYGLTLVDEEPFKEKIESAQSSDEVLHVLNEFTAHYGFEVGLKATIDDVEGVKQGAGDLMDHFYTIPVELGKLSGIKKLDIVDSVPGAYGMPEAGGDTDPFSHTIRIGIDGFMQSGGDIYAHELAHGIDGQLCGEVGMRRDPDFKKLNAPRFKYSESQKTDHDQGRKSTVESYGETNVAEDKATFYQRLIDGISPSMLNSESSVIRAKEDVLLSRLEEKVPHITNYLRDISTDLRS
jgi:hypothetical protein